MKKCHLGIEVITTFRYRSKVRIPYRCGKGYFANISDILVPALWEQRKIVTERETQRQTHAERYELNKKKPVCFIGNDFQAKYGSETWNVGKRDKSSAEAFETWWFEKITEDNVKGQSFN